MNFKINTFFLLPVLLVSLTITCKGQTKSTESCGFFNRVSFKNGTDTLLIKATYDSMGKLYKGDEIKLLAKEGKLNLKDFNYAISFIPENCSDTLYIPSRDQGKEARSLFTMFHPKSIYLKCIFFENHKLLDRKYSDKPFFIVDKILFEK